MHMNNLISLFVVTHTCYFRVAIKPFVIDHYIRKCDQQGYPRGEGGGDPPLKQCTAKQCMAKRKESTGSYKWFQHIETWLCLTRPNHTTVT